MPAEQEISFPDGSKLKSQGKIRREPDPAGSDGRIALTLDSEISGDEARKAFGRMMEGLMGNLPRPKEGRSFSADQIEEFSRVQKSSVVTDPRTLLPSRAMLESTTTITMKGKEKQREVERHEYVFDWSAKAPEAEKPAR